MSRFSRLIEKKENIFQKLNFHGFQAFNFGPCLAITLRSSIRSISLSAPNSTRPLHRSHSLYGSEPYHNSAQLSSIPIAPPWLLPRNLIALPLPLNLPGNSL